jgi:hypothetical protein
MTDEEYEAFITRIEAEAAEADRLYNEKLRILNKRKRERSKRLRELGIKPYAGQKKPSNAQTLCFTCRNSCPNPSKGIGCEWSANLVPVPGWEAIRKDIRPNRADKEALVSYVVVSCPKFVSENS